MLFNGSVSIADKYSMYSRENVRVGSLEVLLHVSVVLDKIRGLAQTQEKQTGYMFTNTFRFAIKTIRPYHLSLPAIEVM
jgi:hypothetical protein